MTDEPTTPRPKRLQIHLSTAVVLTFVAGGLIWANLYERRNDYNCYMAFSEPAEEYNIRFNFEQNVSYADFLKSDNGFAWFAERDSFFGWPHCGCKLKSEITIIKRLQKTETHVKERRWYAGGIAIDALVALGILSSVAIACEWRIRRRYSSTCHSPE